VALKVKFYSSFSSKNGHTWTVILLALFSILQQESEVGLSWARRQPPGPFPHLKIELPAGRPAHQSAKFELHRFPTRRNPIKVIFQAHYYLVVLIKALNPFLSNHSLTTGTQNLPPIDWSEWPFSPTAGAAKNSTVAVFPAAFAVSVYALNQTLGGSSPQNLSLAE
jgi:hypothetical protein